MFIKNRRLVYTVILGYYDDLLEVENQAVDIDYICVTDNHNIKSQTWTVKYLPEDQDPILLNRKYKMMPFLFFDYEQSLYIDGNIKICADLNFIFDKYLNINDIAIPKHGFRNCLYKEADECIRSGKVSSCEVTKQIQYYNKAKYPVENGLFENNVILRNHTDKIKDAMSYWFELFVEYSKRDQLSLCFVLWSKKINCAQITEGPRYSSQYLKLKFHNKEKQLPLLKKINLYISIHSQRHIMYKILNKMLTSSIKLLK